MPCFDAFWREEHNGGRVRIEVDVLVGLALRIKIEVAGNKTQLLVISQNHGDALASVATSWWRPVRPEWGRTDVTYVGRRAPWTGP